MEVIKAPFPDVLVVSIFALTHTKLPVKLKVAIVPIGYADGFSRSLGNGKGSVFIKNAIYPTIGNICMDMLMLDITNINCEEGDDVIIIDDKIQTAEDLGEKTNTISYEILTALSSRIKRTIIDI